MAFKTWVSDGNTTENTAQVDKVTDLAEKGFQSNTVISAKEVNAVLREATVVISQLMKMLGNESLNFRSTEADVMKVLQKLNYNNSADNIGSGVNPIYMNGSKLVASDSSVGEGSGTIESNPNGVVPRLWYMKNGVMKPYATNEQQVNPQAWIGDDNTPIYLKSNGQFYECTYDNYFSLEDIPLLDITRWTTKESIAIGYATVYFPRKYLERAYNITFSDLRVKILRRSVETIVLADTVDAELCSLYEDGPNYTITSNHITFAIKLNSRIDISAALLSGLITFTKK